MTSDHAVMWTGPSMPFEVADLGQPFGQGSNVVLAGPEASSGHPIDDALKKWRQALTYSRQRDTHRKMCNIRSIVELAGWETTAEINMDSVSEVLAELASGEGADRLSSKTLRNKHSVLCVFIEFCVSRGWCSYNPAKAIARPRQTRSGRGVRPITAEELRRLVAVTKRWEQTKYAQGGTRSDLYEFLWLTGLRENECRRLEWNHIDFKNARLRLAGEITKSGRFEALPLTDRAVELLQARHLAHFETNRVWPTFPSERTRDRDIARAGMDKVTDLGPFGWHSFRKGMATHLASSGVPMTVVQQLLRHSDIRVTAEAYVDDRLMDLRQHLGDLEAAATEGK